jgi:hypothetical protein
MCGFPEIDFSTTGNKKLSYEEILKVQWCEEFEILRRNRMIMGYYRYGVLGRQGSIDRTGYIIKKATLFQKDGNLEHLVDIANVAMAAFKERQHPNAHFRSADDEFHGQIEK